MDIPLLTLPMCWGGEFSVLIYKTPTCFGLDWPILRECGCIKRELGRIIASSLRNCGEIISV